MCRSWDRVPVRLSTLFRICRVHSWLISLAYSLISRIISRIICHLEFEEILESCPKSTQFLNRRHVGVDLILVLDEYVRIFAPGASNHVITRVGYIWN